MRGCTYLLLRIYFAAIEIRANKLLYRRRLIYLRMKYEIAVHYDPAPDIINLCLETIKGIKSMSPLCSNLYRGPNNSVQFTASNSIMSHVTQETYRRQSFIHENLIKEN